MGNSNLPVANIPIQSEHASTALSKLFDKYPDAYLITLGPMTNVALAVSLDPSLANKVKKGHFWMMGGSHLSKGNSTYSAEFNVYFVLQVLGLVLISNRSPIRCFLFSKLNIIYLMKFISQ